MGTTQLIVRMAVLVLVGAPMVWYLWEALNEILAGVFDATRLLIAVTVLIVFLLYMGYVGRTVTRWDEGDADS